MGLFDFFKREKQEKKGTSLETNHTFELRLFDEQKYNKANKLVKQASDYGRNRNFDKGIDLIEKALTIYEYNEWYDKLANYAFKSNNVKKALKALDNRVLCIKK